MLYAEPSAASIALEADMYHSIVIDVYKSITMVDPQSYQQPDLDFTIPNEQITDWHIDPQRGSAEDIFEIYGNSAQLSILKTGDFAAWITQKSINPDYPDYMNAVIHIKNASTNEIIFAGALPLEFIEHDYDENLMSITIIDALNIWIREARKHHYAFEDGIYRKSCAFVPSHPVNLSVSDVLERPVKNLAWGLNQFYETFTEPDPIIANDYPLIIDGYSDDFRQWQMDLPNGLYGGWQAFVPILKYYADDRYFNVILLHAYRGGVTNDSSTWYWRYRIKTIRIYANAMFQPMMIYEHLSEPVFSPAALRAQLTQMVNNPILIDGGLLIFDEPASLTVNIDGFDYAIAAVDSDGNTFIEISCPISMQEVFFSGRISYDKIMLAMLTANQLSLRTQPNGLKLITNNVALVPQTSALDIPDSVIVNQRRTGINADITRIASALTVAAGTDNMIGAIQDSYRNAMESLSCRLVFSLLDSYYTNTAIDIFKIIKIDGYNYTITSIAYPQDGIFEVEAVGHWN